VGHRPAELKQRGYRPTGGGREVNSLVWRLSVHAEMFPGVMVSRDLMGMLGSGHNNRCNTNAPEFDFRDPRQASAEVAFYAIATHSVARRH
jgi:hypothetical protein